MDPYRGRDDTNPHMYGGDWGNERCPQREGLSETQCQNRGMIRRVRGEFVSRLETSDGGDYSKSERSVSSRGGGAVLSRKKSRAWAWLIGVEEEEEVGEIGETEGGEGGKWEMI